MIISTREAFLGKRELKPQRSGRWIQILSDPSGGWPKNIIEKFGLKRPDERIQIKGLSARIVNSIDVFVCKVGADIGPNSYDVERFVTQKPGDPKAIEKHVWFHISDGFDEVDKNAILGLVDGLSVEDFHSREEKRFPIEDVVQ